MRQCSVHAAPPVCRPLLLLDGTLIQNEQESLLVMERATCSLSVWHKQWTLCHPISGDVLPDRLAGYVRIYTKVVEGAYVLDRAGVIHSDAHMGNIVVSLYDDKGDIFPNALLAYQRISFEHPSSAVQFVDFGKSSWQRCLPEDSGQHVSQGVTSYMAPEGFFPSDGWAVLVLGYHLVGIFLPWYDINRNDPKAVDKIEASKASCLFGSNFHRNHANLVALISGATVSSWRRRASAKMKELKWPFVDFMDALFRALIENELDVLRHGYPTLKWSERLRHVSVPDI